MHQSRAPCHNVKTLCAEFKVLASFHRRSKPFKMMFRPRFFLLLLLLLVIWAVVVQGGQVYNFQGKDFIRYDSSFDNRVQHVRNDFLSLKNVYRFRFKTIHSSGIFLFSEGTRGDYISIVMLHCKLRVVIHRQVQKDSTPEELFVVTGSDLCDGNWHIVHLVRNGKMACVNLDYSKRCHRMPGTFSTLDVDLHTFVAGIDQTIIKPSNKHQDISQVPNYRGCLRSVLLNNVNVLGAAMKKKKHTKIYGSLNKFCPGQILRNVIGFNSHSYLMLEAPARRALKLSFNFRTYYDNGLLFHSQSALFVKLLMVSGSLEFQPYMEGPQGIQHQIKFKVGKNLADGNWHFVIVRINSNGFTLSIDKDEIRWKKPKHLKAAKLLPFKSTVFGYGLGFKSFIGCLDQLRVNKNLKNESNNLSKDLHFGSCPIRNLCFPNPCKHEAKCINKARGFSCDCSGLHYAGRLCTEPFYRSSCQEYVKLGLSRDAMCSVLPNRNIPSTPFKVLCKMTGSRMSTAVVENDKKGWEKVEEHSSTNYAGGPYLPIHYSLNVRNIKAVISGSRRCFQYLAINCTMLNVSGNNQCLAHWITSNKKNSNPVPIITNDYIREKSMLPVIAIQFCPDAVGCYYNVGPLKCIGTKRHSKPLPHSVNARKFVKNVCNPLVPPSDNGNRAHRPEDNTKVDSGFMSLKTETLLKLEETATSNSKIKETPSVSSTEKLAVTKEARETSQFIINTEQKTSALTAQSGKRSSKTALNDRWEFFAALAIGSAFLILLLSFLCASTLVKRKMKAESGPEGTPSEPADTRRKSVSDEIGLQPESDLWMKVNSCGYNVKTGKITYGHDIYRVS